MSVQSIATQWQYDMFLALCLRCVCILAPHLPCKLKADALASSCAEEVLLPVHVGLPLDASAYWPVSPGPQKKVVGMIAPPSALRGGWLRSLGSTDLLKPTAVNPRAWLVDHIIIPVSCLVFTHLERLNRSLKALLQQQLESARLSLLQVDGQCFQLRAAHP